MAVVGPGDADHVLLALAREVGAGLAHGGATVVTGGLGGVMAAAARGAREAGGTTVGLLPGEDRGDAATDLTVTLPTGLGEGRNLLVVRAAHAVVCIGGSWGTVSEVALAHRLGVPVVTVRGWTVLDDGGCVVGGPTTPSVSEAVQLALTAARRAAGA